MTKYPIPNVVLPILSVSQRKMAEVLLLKARESIKMQHSRMLCYALRKAAGWQPDTHFAWVVADHLQYAIHDSLSGCATYTEWVTKIHPAYANNTEILVEGRLQWIDDILGKLNDV